MTSPSVREVDPSEHLAGVPKVSGMDLGQSRVKSLVQSLWRLTGDKLSSKHRICNSPASPGFLFSSSSRCFMGLANEELPCEGVPQISFDPKIIEIIPILGAAGQGSQVSSWIKSFHLEKNNNAISIRA